jgi:hypothetical protein
MACSAPCVQSCTRASVSQQTQAVWHHCKKLMALIRTSDCVGHVSHVRNHTQSMLVCDCCLRHHPCDATWAPNVGARQNAFSSHTKTPRAEHQNCRLGPLPGPNTRNELGCVTHRSSSRNGLGFVGNAQGAPEALGWQAGQSRYSYLNGLRLSFHSLLPVLDGSNRIQSTQQGWYIGALVHGSPHAGQSPHTTTESSHSKSAQHPAHHSSRFVRLVEVHASLQRRR